MKYEKYTGSSWGCGWELFGSGCIYEARFRPNVLISPLICKHTH